MSATPVLPNFADVLDAAARIAPHLPSTTPLLRVEALDALADAELLFKAEHLQRGGAFKFRGACNAVWALDAHSAARGVLTHSSGNHGAALALAAASRGIPCHVVVPDGANPAKLEAILAHGAQVQRCAATQQAREQTCARLQAHTGAELVHPYADARVIAGQGTVALELLCQAGRSAALDAVVVPVGGGGLCAGVALVLATLAPHVQVYAAEPAGADDALRSLQRGERVVDVVPDTLCDGLRATIGEPNLQLLQRHGVQVLPVEDAATVQAMALLWRHGRQLVEPSSATVLAAVLADPARFAGRRVGLVLSGGNVDPALFPSLFTPTDTVPVARF
ncbi:MAG: pyridoxal-phosphate dependent enzyme [Pseudoxanthomonas suwonensis]|nr:pyridoxal-phosphate dependent enzyme [Pseudoxanthomonas suwonensis]